MRIYVRDKRRLGLWLWMPNGLLLNSLTAEIAVRIAKSQGRVQLDKKELLQMMKELRRKYRMSMLMITHDLRLLSQVDHVLFMENGRVLDSGSHRELMSRCGAYRTLVLCDEEVSHEKEAL